MTLCNDAVENPDGTVQGEPTGGGAGALRRGQRAWPRPGWRQEQPRAAEAPFDSSRKMMSTIHKTDDGFDPVHQGRTGRGAAPLHQLLGERHGCCP